MYMKQSLVFGYGHTRTNSMYINCRPQSQETSWGSARRRRQRGSEWRRAVECLLSSYCAASVFSVKLRTYSELTRSNTTRETRRGKNSTLWEGGTDFLLRIRWTDESCRAGITLLGVLNPSPIFEEEEKGVLKPGNSWSQQSVHHFICRRQDERLDSRWDPGAAASPRSL